MLELNMNVPTFPNSRVRAIYTTIVGLLVALIVGTALASFLIGRYYRDQETRARCEYLGRLLASELNQPGARDLIAARCLQSK